MWQHPRNQLFPWMHALSQKLRACRIPRLTGTELWIVSDYTFGNKKADFDAIGILLANPTGSTGWQEARLAVRHNLLGDARKMSFKSLNDRKRQAAFFPFLAAADRIEGLCVTIAFHRRIQHLFATTKVLDDHKGSDWLKSDWSLTSFDRMCRIAHFIAFFIAGVSQPGQNLLWISDQDDAFANEKMHRDTGTLFTKFLNLYSPHSFGTISIGTTVITEEDLMEEDLAAIPDIAVGGSVELLSCISKRYGCIPGFSVEFPSSVPLRTHNFAEWFFDQSKRLKKIGCVLDDRGPTKRVGVWNGFVR